MDGIKSSNLALRFLLELASLVAFVYWGFRVGQGRTVQSLLGIGVPLLVIVIWAVFVSPNAAVSVPRVAKTVVGLVILEFAAVALFVAGQRPLGVAFGAILVINAVLMLVWGQ
jgi:hypothetical protein